MSESFPTEASLRNAIAESEGALFYFSAPTCNVCQVLRPKVEALMAERYPRMTFRYVDVSAAPEAARALGIGSIPTVMGVLDGHEAFRLVRVFGMGEIQERLDRPYGLLFGESA